MDMSPELKKHIDNIMDCFTGVDGGSRYLMFRGGIEQLDKQSIEGDPDSKTLISVVINFSNLIKLLNRENKYTK